ncbi:MAG: hypothetical protein M3347_09270 [Armatimonadota bacterium]|nr:hypothetical protein [Armatimonadota bacterium]
MKDGLSEIDVNEVESLIQQYGEIAPPYAGLTKQQAIKLIMFYTGVDELEAEMLYHVHRGESTGDVREIKHK